MDKLKERVMTANKRVVAIGVLLTGAILTGAMITKRRKGIKKNG